MAYFKLKIYQLNTEDAPSFLYPKMPQALAKSDFSSVGKP